MTTLSDNDIKQELAKGNILIFPFIKNNLKGASYNLTVSRFAYKVPTQKNAHWESAYDSLTNKVIIPGKSTVLVSTNEAIYVSDSISGTYHSRVTQVSKGLGHIGTTLDPGYLGVSIIALHNLSEKEIELIPEKDTFVSLIFRYVKTRASVSHANQPGRPDVLPELTQEEKEWFYQDFRINSHKLQQKLENESTDFKDIKNEYKSKKQRLYFLLPYVSYGLLITASALLAGYLTTNYKSLREQAWYSTANFLADKATPVFLGALAAQLVSDIQRISKER